MNGNEESESSKRRPRCVKWIKKEEIQRGQDDKVLCNLDEINVQLLKSNAAMELVAEGQEMAREQDLDYILLQFLTRGSEQCEKVL